MSVERTHTRMAQLGDRLLLFRERAVAPCGCCALTGIFVGATDPAVVFLACSPDHQGQIGSATDVYRDSLTNPTPRPAVDVADEVLRGALGVAA